jgi:hypothetical protein
MLRVRAEGDQRSIGLGDDPVTTTSWSTRSGSPRRSMPIESFRKMTTPTRIQGWRMLSFVTVITCTASRAPVIAA